jgi:hypothetical protein
MSTLIKQRDLVESKLVLDSEDTAALQELIFLNRALHQAYADFLTPIERATPTARVTSVFFDEEYIDGKLPTTAVSSPAVESATKEQHALPAFDKGMKVAFCDHNAQASGSGTITRIIRPGSVSSHSVMGSLDPSLEIRYEIQSGSGLVTATESTMWKTVGTMQRNNPTLNPSYRPCSVAQEVFTAQITTAAELQRHEERIYQPGYTPKAIRNSIQKMLQESNPNQHLVDFQERDIPPPERDPITHRTLTDLLQLRRRLEQDFKLDISSVAADGTRS